MKALLLTILVTLFPVAAWAAESNPFAEQCHRLADLKSSSQVFQHFASGGFWKDGEMTSTYLLALHGKSTNSKRDKSERLGVPDRAAIVLAAIVRHDLSLMSEFYDMDVSSYFVGAGWSVMTFAASCDFSEGVSFLLRTGANPNAGSGVGPFNIAMTYGNSGMARLLLAHGYLIEQDDKRCQSSKFIVTRLKERIPSFIYRAVESKKCAAVRAGPRWAD